MGKIRLVQTPWANHSWHVALYLTAQGLTTSPIPYAARAFEIEFDFLDHRLRIKTSEGRNEALELAPRAVASFYEELFARLTTPGLEIRIRNMPNEIPDATDRVLKAFRSRFIGKSSPVHFFWVSFDVAVTRFSGRRAPPHPGGYRIFPTGLPGKRIRTKSAVAASGRVTTRCPTPCSTRTPIPSQTVSRQRRCAQPVRSTNASLGEFVLPYEEVRQATSPDATLQDFLQSSYAEAADLGGWDRPALERE
jgi:hypothetical protein